MAVIRIGARSGVKSRLINVLFSNTQRSKFASHITIGSGISLATLRNRESEERFMGHPLLDLTDRTAVVIGGTRASGLRSLEAWPRLGRMSCQQAAARNKYDPRPRKLWR